MGKKINLVLFAVAISLVLYYTNKIQDSKLNLKTESCVSSSSVKTEIFNKYEQEIKIEGFYNFISQKEFKKYSQNKEDGIIDFLIEFVNLGEIGYKGFYVEFGTEKGNEINTKYLKEKRNWTGLLMDGSNENLAIDLHKEVILHSNILSLFKKYNVPVELDLFSEDTDYADYWITEQVLTEYKPKIVVQEVNQQGPELCVTVPKPAGLVYWDSSNYHGGSVCAFQCLAKRFNYTMVYCESAGVNCFLLRDDLLIRALKVNVELFQKILNPSKLYKRPGFSYKSTSNPWFYVNCTI
jgi:hypothetical protein